MPKLPDENDRKQAGNFTDDPMEGLTPLTPLAPPPARLRQLGELADEALATMLRRQRGEERPVATPWAGVNRALQGGLWPGFYTLTSASGVGKTQWALQVAIEAASGELAVAIEVERLRGKGDPRATPRPIFYIALELGAVDMVARALGLLEAMAGQRVMWSDLAFGRHPEIAAIFERNRVALRTLPLFFEVAPPRGWDSDRLEVLAKENPRLVVLDYLQLIGRLPREDVREAMGRVAYQARAMARDHDCVVLALSSTARMNYGATNGAAGPESSGRRRDEGDAGPGKGDPSRFIGLGKESGDIEFAADGVFALINEPRAEGERFRATHLAIAKQRGASSGWVELRFDGSRFDEGTGDRPLPRGAI